MNKIEEQYNRKPQVLLLDSLDDFSSERKYDMPRFEMKHCFIQTRQLTYRKRLITFTTTQGRRDSEGKRKLTAKDIWEDISRFAKTDGMIWLARTEEDDDMGIIRAGARKSKLGVKRHKEAILIFNEDYQLIEEARRR